MQQESYIQRAIPEILSLFQDSYYRPLRKPYYIRQIHVLLENQFFPWIVSHALDRLEAQHDLVKMKYTSRAKRKLVFYYHGKLNDPSYLPTMTTHIKSASNLVDRYATPRISRYLGKHLEALVKAELRAQQFNIVSMNSNSFNNKRWTKSNHNLDFIAEHESGNLNIGVEVKNTLGLIERKELDIKLEMCKHLGIRPVFAVRWIKPYTQIIAKHNDGFSWVFKTQIYPLGLEELTVDLYKKLQLPVNVRTDLPPKSVQLFKRWVDKNT